MTPEVWSEVLDKLVRFLLKRHVAGGKIELKNLLTLFVLLGSSAKAGPSTPTMAQFNSKYPILAAALETERFEALLSNPPNVQIVAGRFVHPNANISVRLSSQLWFRLKILEKTWAQANLNTEWKEYLARLVSSKKVSVTLTHFIKSMLGPNNPLDQLNGRPTQQLAYLSSTFKIPCVIRESSVLGQAAKAKENIMKPTKLVVKKIESSQDSLSSSASSTQVSTQ